MSSIRREGIGISHVGDTSTLAFGKYHNSPDLHLCCTAMQVVSR